MLKAASRHQSIVSPLSVAKKKQLDSYVGPFQTSVNDRHHTTSKQIKHTAEVEYY